MTREDFVKWLETETLFDRRNTTDDSEWRYLVDYADYIWDELEVKDDSVVFDWEELGWGTHEYKTQEYSFDNFVELYERDELK